MLLVQVANIYIGVSRVVLGRTGELTTLLRTTVTMQNDHENCVLRGKSNNPKPVYVYTEFSHPYFLLFYLVIPLCN